MANKTMYQDDIQNIITSMQNTNVFDPNSNILDNLNQLSKSNYGLPNNNKNVEFFKEFIKQLHDIIQRAQTDNNISTNQQNQNQLNKNINEIISTLPTLLQNNLATKGKKAGEVTKAWNTIRQRFNEISSISFTDENISRSLKNIIDLLNSLNNIKLINDATKHDLEFTKVGLNAINEQLKLANSLTEKDERFKQSTKNLYASLSSNNQFSDRLDAIHTQIFQIREGYLQNAQTLKELITRDISKSSFDELMGTKDYIDRYLNKVNTTTDLTTQLGPEIDSVSLNASVKLLSDVHNLAIYSHSAINTWLKNTLLAGTLTDEQEQQLKDAVEQSLKNVQNNPNAIINQIHTIVQNKIQQIEHSVDFGQSSLLSNLANGRNLGYNIDSSINRTGRNASQLWQQIATSKYTTQTSYNPLKFLSQPWLNSSLKNIQRHAGHAAQLQFESNKIRRNISNLQTQAQDAYKQGDELTAQNINQKINDQIESLALIITQLNKASAMIGQEWSNLAESDRKRLDHNNQGMNRQVQEILQSSKETTNYFLALKTAYNIKSDSGELESLNDVNSALKDLTKEAQETGKKSENSKSGLSNFVQSLTSGISGFFNSIQRLINGLGLGDFILGPISLSAKAHEFYRQQGQERYSSMGAAALIGADNLELEAARAQSRMMAGNQLYMASGGLIDQMAIQKSYRSMLQIGGQVGQSAEQTTADMDFLARQTALMQNVYGLDQSVVNDVVKTYYRDMRLSANEASQAFYRLTQTAQSANVPIDQYLKSVADLANKYMSIGIAGHHAENVLDELMDRHIRLDIAQEVAAQLGSVAQKFAEDDNKVAFAAAMQGEDPFQGLAKAARTHDEKGDPREEWFSDMLGYMSTDMSLKSMAFGNDKDLSFWGMTKMLKDYGFDGRASSILASIAKEKGAHSVDFKEMFIKESKRLDNPNATLEEKNQQIADQLSVMANQLAETDRLQALSRGRLFQEASVIGKGIDELANAFAPVLLAFQQTMIELTIKAVQAISDFVSGDLFDEARKHILDAIKWLPVALGGFFVFFFGKKLLGLVFTLLGGAKTAILALLGGVKKYGPAALRMAKGLPKNPLAYAGITLLGEFVLPMFKDKIDVLEDMVKVENGRSLKDLLPSFPDTIEWKDRPKFDLDHPDDHPFMQKYQNDFAMLDKILSGDLSSVSNKESQEEILTRLKQIRADQWKDGTKRPELLKKLDEVEKTIKNLQSSAQPSLWEQAQDTANGALTTLSSAYYLLGTLSSDGTAPEQITNYVLNNANSYTRLALGPSTPSSNVIEQQNRQALQNYKQQTSPSTNISQGQPNTLPYNTNRYYDPNYRDATDTMRMLNPNIAYLFTNGQYTSQVTRDGSVPIDNGTGMETAIKNADNSRAIAMGYTQDTSDDTPENLPDDDTEVFGEQFEQPKAEKTVQQFTSDVPPEETDPITAVAKTIKDKDDIIVQYDDNELPILAQITTARNRKLREELQDLYDQRQSLKEQIASEREHMELLKAQQKRLSDIISDPNTSQIDKDAAIEQSKINQSEMDQTAQLIGQLVTQETQNFSDIKTKKDTLEKNVKSDLYEQAHNTRSIERDEASQTQTKDEETSRNVNGSVEQSENKSVEAHDKVSTNIKDVNTTLQEQQSQGTASVLDGVKNILSALLGIKTDDKQDGTNKQDNTNKSDDINQSEQSLRHSEDIGYKDNLTPDEWKKEKERIADTNMRKLYHGETSTAYDQNNNKFKCLTDSQGRITIVNSTAINNGLDETLKWGQSFARSGDQSNLINPTQHMTNSNAAQVSGPILTGYAGNTNSLITRDSIKKYMAEHISKMPSPVYQSSTFGNVDPNAIQNANKSGIAFWKWFKDAINGRGSINDTIESNDTDSENTSNPYNPYASTDDDGERGSWAPVIKEAGQSIKDSAIKVREENLAKRKEQAKNHLDELAEVGYKGWLAQQEVTKLKDAAEKNARNVRTKNFNELLNDIQNIPSSISNFIKEMDEAKEQANKIIEEVNKTIYQSNEDAMERQEMLGKRLSDYFLTSPYKKIEDPDESQDKSTDWDKQMGRFVTVFKKPEEEKKEETPSLSAEEVNKQMQQGQGHIEYIGGYPVYVLGPAPKKKESEKSNVKFNGYNYEYTGEKLREQMQQAAEERKRKEIEAYHKEIQEFSERTKIEDAESRKQLANLVMPSTEQFRINSLFDDSKWSSNVDVDQSDNDKKETNNTAPLSREAMGQKITAEVTNEQRKEQTLSKVANIQLKAFMERHEILIKLFSHSVKDEHGDIWRQLQISQKILTDIINTTANGFAYITEAIKTKGGISGGSFNSNTGGTNISDSNIISDNKIMNNIGTTYIANDDDINGGYGIPTDDNFFRKLSSGAIGHYVAADPNFAPAGSIIRYKDPLNNNQWTLALVVDVGEAIKGEGRYDIWRGGYDLPNNPYDDRGFKQNIETQILTNSSVEPEEFSHFHEHVNDPNWLRQHGVNITDNSNISNDIINNPDYYIDESSGGLKNVSDDTRRFLYAVANAWHKAHPELEALRITSTKRHGDGSSYHDIGAAFDVANSYFNDKNLRNEYVALITALGGTPLDEWEGEPGHKYANGNNIHATTPNAHITPGGNFARQVAYKTTQLLDNNGLIDQNEFINSNVAFTDEQKQLWQEQYDKLEQIYQKQFEERIDKLLKNNPLFNYEDELKHYQEEIALLASQIMGYNIHSPNGLANFKQLQELMQTNSEGLFKQNSSDLIYRDPNEMKNMFKEIPDDQTLNQTIQNGDMQLNYLSGLDIDEANKRQAEIIQQQQDLSNIAQQTNANTLNNQLAAQSYQDDKLRIDNETLARQAQNLVPGTLLQQSSSTPVKQVAYRPDSFKGYTSDETGSWNNCGPTSIATMLTASGINKKPSEILQYMNDNNIMVGPANMKSVMSQFGLNTTFIDHANADQASIIAQALSSGQSVMFGWGSEANYDNGAYGSGTSSGHYTTALGITEDGYVLMSDPGRSGEEHYTKSKLTLQELLKYLPDVWISGQAASADIAQPSYQSNGFVPANVASTANAIKGLTGNGQAYQKLYGDMQAPDMRPEIKTTGQLDTSVLEEENKKANEKIQETNETDEQRKEREKAEQTRIKMLHDMGISKAGIRYKDEDINKILEEHPEWNKYQNKEEIATELDKKPEYGLDDNKLLQYYGVSVTGKDETSTKALTHQVAVNIRNGYAPNGTKLLDNDIQYLVNNGYTEDAAKAELFQSEKYKPKPNQSNRPARGPAKAVVSARGDYMNTVYNDEIFMGTNSPPNYGEGYQPAEVIIAQSSIKPIINQNNNTTKPTPTASSVFNSAQSLQKISALRSKLAAANKITEAGKRQAKSYNTTTKMSKEDADDVTKKIINLNIPWDMGKSEIDSLMETIKAIVADGFVEPKEKKSFEQLLLDMNVSAENIEKINAILHKDSVDSLSNSK